MCDGTLVDFGIWSKSELDNDLMIGTNTGSRAFLLQRAPGKLFRDLKGHFHVSEEVQLAGISQVSQHHCRSPKHSWAGRAP